MADPVITCVDPNISLSQLLNSVLVQTADGTVGIRTLTVSADAEDITDYAACNNVELSAEQILRRAFGITPDGKTALILVEEAP